MTISKRDREARSNAADGAAEHLAAGARGDGTKSGPATAARKRAAAKAKVPAAQRAGAAIGRATRSKPPTRAGRAKPGVVASIRDAIKETTTEILAGAATAAAFEAAKEARVETLQKRKKLKPLKVAGKALKGAFAGAITAAVPTIAEATGISDAPELLGPKKAVTRDRPAVMTNVTTEALPAADENPVGQLQVEPAAVLFVDVDEPARTKRKKKKDRKDKKKDKKAKKRKKKKKDKKRKKR